MFLAFRILILFGVFRPVFAGRVVENNARLHVVSEYTELDERVFDGTGFHQHSSA